MRPLHLHHTPTPVATVLPLRHISLQPLHPCSSTPQVAAEAAAFGAALLADLATGRLEANEQARAEQLRGVIERLGPA